MKKIYLILLIICFTGCVSAQVEQLPIHKTNATVQNIYGDVAILQPNDSRISYEVASDSTLLKDKEYVFWLELADCQDCRTIKAVIVNKAFTTGQVQKDQADISKELSHRKIIK